MDVLSTPFFLHKNTAAKQVYYS